MNEVPSRARIADPGVNVVAVAAPASAFTFLIPYALLIRFQLHRMVWLS